MKDTNDTNDVKANDATGGPAKEPGPIESYFNSKVDTFTAPANKAQEQARAISEQAEASGKEKGVAVGFVVIDTAKDVTKAISGIKGMGKELADKALIAILGKLSFLRGIACLPIVKQLDPVLGIDIHHVIIPPVPVVPMPHFYIGLMLEPKDFVACALLSVSVHIPPPKVPPIGEGSMSDANVAKALNMGHALVIGAIKNLGASVKIGPFIPRVVASTPSKPLPHFIMGTGYSPPFLVVKKNVGYSFLGSLFVNADGYPLTGGIAHLHNDCWDIGMIPLEKKLKKAADKLFKVPPPPPPPKPKPPVIEFYMPTGIMIPIPWNRPILVNPVPTPMNPTKIVEIFVSAGFAKLESLVGIDKVKQGIEAAKRRFGEKIIGRLANTKLGRKIGCNFWNKVSDKYGTGTSHPADVSQGHFYTKGTDFSIPGIIPLNFKRIYNSYNDFDGALGMGWSHNYALALAFDYDENLVAMRMEDGRPTGFEIPEKGKSYYNRKDKLWFHHNMDGSFHVSDKKGYIYKFTEKEYKNKFNKSENHLLQSISNRNGYSIRFSYTDDGILEQITDTAGRIYSVENDGKGHISRIIAPAAKQGEEPFVITSYEYDSQGRMVTQTNAMNNSMYFEYNGTLMIKETWRNGIAWEISYDRKDHNAKCLEIKGSGGLFHHKLDYVSENCTVVTNSLGNKTTYHHHNGLVVKRIDPNGAETTFRYNSTNELEWSSDPLGNVSSASYDDLGNLVNKTSTDGGFIQLEYDNSRFPYLPTSAIDAVGGRWKWTYDKQGNLITRTNPVQANTTFEYEDGLLSVITGASEQRTHLTYDEQGNLTQVNSHDGGETEWRYDKLGQCIRFKNAREGVSKYEYNALGDATRIKLADGNIRELTYDTMRNVVVAKDNDRFVTFTYKGVNKLASRTEKGAKLSFLYDTEDQLRAIENENDEQYRFILDAQGNVVQEIGFDGLTRTYRRDIGGRVNSVVRPSGKEIAYEYDEIGRTTKVIYEDGSEESYTYLKNGMLSKANNADAEVTLERDILGRITKEISNGHEVSSFYDIESNRTKITSNLGANIEAEYNLLGDVISLATEGWETQYERDLFGLETQRSLSQGMQTSTSRDNLGRVTAHNLEKGGRTLSEKSYLWGTNNKLLSVNDNGKETQFEYDSWGNLAKTLFADGKIEHRNPDKSGNLFESLDRLDRKYTKGGQLVKTENWEYKYDKEGNLIRKKDKRGLTWRYEWNSAGMLSKVTRPDKLEVNFKYDALGRRIEKSFRNTITRWVWDGNTPLHEWREIVTKDYSEEKGYFTNIEKRPITTWVFEEGTFRPTAKITEQRKLSIVTNYLGTPEAMYDSQGESFWSCELNSFGKVRNFKGELKTDCPFRYQGQYEDSETGLYYNRFRYYSPDEGMYISQDPIRLSGGRTLYSYVHDTNGWIDVFGLEECNVDQEFEDGAAYLVTGDAHDAYIEGQDMLGRPDGQFVAPTTQIDTLLAEAGGNISIIEKGLGIPEGDWQEKGGIYKVSIANPQDYNLRAPTSDMSGANSLFVEGGKTSGGISEGVIDQVPREEATITKVV